MGVDNANYNNDLQQNDLGGGPGVDMGGDYGNVNHNNVPQQQNVNLGGNPGVNMGGWGRAPPMLPARAAPYPAQQIFPQQQAPVRPARHPQPYGVGPMNQQGNANPGNPGQGLNEGRPPFTGGGTRLSLQDVLDRQQGGYAARNLSTRSGH